MSLNQAAEVGVAGKGGILLGGYEPSEDGVPVTTKARKRATNPAITRGQVITIEKSGSDKGKIRAAVSGDFGPFGMAWKDKELNDTRIEFISKNGAVLYLESNGAIAPGMPVKVGAVAGTVEEADVSSTIFDDDNTIVGYCEGKAIEVSKRASGTATPSAAADGDIVAVKLTYEGIV